MALQSAFDRIKGVINRATDRFNRAFHRTKPRVKAMVQRVVARVTHLTSLETIKSTATQIKQNVKDGNILKYFKSKSEFLKLLQPL